MDKKHKVEVRKIDIQIGDKTISLKPEQAKELKKILNEMFEESTDKTIHHYWWNTWPTYTNPYPSPTPYWTVTCWDLGVETLSNGSTDFGNVTLCLNSSYGN